MARTAAASEKDSGIGVDALEFLTVGAGVIVGLGAFGATDSRRGRDEAAVTVVCAGADGTGRIGDFLVSLGDTRAGEGSSLGSFELNLLALGVLGPAGASGTCTVLPFVEDLRESGSGIDVCATGEWTTDVEYSLGVETAEVDVEIGDAVASEIGRPSCSLGRLASGCCMVLACVDTDASRVASEPPSFAGSGDASRFRLFDGRVIDLLFWLEGVVTA